MSDEKQKKLQGDLLRAMVLRQIEIDPKMVKIAGHDPGTDHASPGYQPGRAHSLSGKTPELQALRKNIEKFGFDKNQSPFVVERNGVFYVLAGRGRTFVCRLIENSGYTVNVLPDTTKAIHLAMLCDALQNASQRPLGDLSKVDTVKMVLGLSKKQLEGKNPLEFACDLLGIQEAAVKNYIFFAEKAPEKLYELIQNEILSFSNALSILRAAETRSKIDNSDISAEARPIVAKIEREPKNARRMVAEFTAQTNTLRVAEEGPARRGRLPTTFAAPIDKVAFRAMISEMISRVNSRENRSFGHAAHVAAIEMAQVIFREKEFSEASMLSPFFEEYERQVRARANKTAKTAVRTKRAVISAEVTLDDDEKIQTDESVETTDEPISLDDSGITLGDTP